MTHWGMHDTDDDFDEFGFSSDSDFYAEADTSFEDDSDTDYIDAEDSEASSDLELQTKPALQAQDPSQVRTSSCLQGIQPQGIYTRRMEVSGHHNTCNEPEHRRDTIPVQQPCTRDRSHPEDRDESNHTQPTTTPVLLCNSSNRTCTST